MDRGVAGPQGTKTHVTRPEPLLKPHIRGQGSVNQELGAKALLGGPQREGRERWWLQDTYCFPSVAGLRTYLSKYILTRRSRSSRCGSSKLTISSIRSLMAQSNCSGWLLARTSMNLRRQKQELRAPEPSARCWALAAGMVMAWAQANPPRWFSSRFRFYLPTAPYPPAHPAHPLPPGSTFGLGFLRPSTGPCGAPSNTSAPAHPMHLWLVVHG